MTSTIDWLIEQARGEYDRQYLTETGTGDFSSSGFLASKPIIEYLKDGEIPHYILCAGEQSLTVSDPDAEKPPSNGNYGTFTVLTNERILVLVGSSEGDYEHSERYVNVESVSTSVRGKYRTASELTLLTHDQSSIAVEDKQGINITSVTQYIREQAAREKLQFADEVLNSVEQSNRSKPVKETIAKVKQGYIILKPAVEWSRDGKIEQRDQFEEVAGRLKSIREEFGANAMHGHETDQFQDKADTEQEPTNGDDGASSEDSASPTKVDLTIELNRLNESLDRPIKSTDMHDDGAYSLQQYYNAFDSWDRALEAAGIDRTDQSLDEVGRVTDQIGRFPSQSEFSENASISANVVVSSFHDWQSLLGAYAKRENLTGEDAPDELLLGELSRVSKRISGRVQPSDIAKFGVYDPGIIVQRFGSWEVALKESGIEVGSEGEEIDTAVSNQSSFSPDESPQAETESPEDNDRSETLLEAIARIAATLSHPIRSTDLKNESKFAQLEYQEEFENWNEAVEAAGVDRKQNLLDEIDKVAREIGDVPSKSDFEAHSEVSPRVVTGYFDYWGDAIAAYNNATATYQYQSKTRGVTESGTQSSNLTEHGESTDQTKPSNEDLWIGFHRVANELGFPPSAKQYGEKTDYNWAHLTGRIGAWEEVKKEYKTWAENTGRSPVTQSSETEENGQQLVEEKHWKEFHRVAGELGRIPSCGEFNTKANCRSVVLTAPIGPWEEVKKEYEVWAVKTGHEKVPPGTDTTESQPDVKLPDPSQRTTLDELPSNTDLEQTVEIEILSVRSGQSNRVETILDIEDTDGNSATMEVWENHDIEFEWGENQWIEISEFRVSRWGEGESNDVHIRTTDEFEIRRAGTDETKSAKTDAVKGDQAESGNNETARTEQEPEGSAEKNDTQDSEGLLGEIEGEFDDLDGW